MISAEWEWGKDGQVEGGSLLPVFDGSCREIFRARACKVWSPDSMKQSNGVAVAFLQRPSAFLRMGGF